MSVEVANLEPSSKVDWQSEKNELITVQLTKKPIQNLDDNTDDKRLNQFTSDSVEKSNNYHISFKNALEDLAKANQVESALSNLKENLNNLKRTAEQSKNVNSNDEIAFNKNEFENAKNNIAKLLNQTDLNNNYIFDNNISNKINSEFIESLNIDNNRKIDSTIKNIDNIITSTDEKIIQNKADLEKSNETLTSLISTDKSLSNNYIQITDSTLARTETLTIGSIILGNIDDASKAQANSRYDNYIKLLQASFITGKQQNQD